MIKYYKCIKNEHLFNFTDESTKFTLVDYEVNDIIMVTKNQKRYYELKPDELMNESGLTLTSWIIDHESAEFFHFFIDITKEYLRAEKLKNVLNE